MRLSKLNILDTTKAPSIIIIALIFNIAIFILIQQLVSNELTLNLNLSALNPVELIRTQQRPEQPEQKKEIDEIEPPPLEEPPPPPKMAEPQIEKPQPMESRLSPPDINMPLSLSGSPYLGDFSKNALKAMPRTKPSKPNIDINVVPTLRIPPVYPLRALRSGIQGVVTVEFIIAIDGSVKNPVIINAKPPKIFDSAVLKAISKWKYNPDMIDGKPVEKKARQDVKFKLKR
jgi:protein TonB